MIEDWLVAFRKDANRAIAELFSGRAGSGGPFHLEVPEFLYQAFLPDQGSDHQLLDRSLLKWLLDMRSD